MKVAQNSLKVKKITALVLVGAMLVTTATLCGFKFTKSASAATAVESSGLGMSVNAVTNNYLDLTEFKDGSPIFDISWLSRQKENANKITINSTTERSYYSSSFKEISQKYSKSQNYSAEVTANADLFEAGVAYGFTRSATEYYSAYANNLFYILNTQMQRYTLSLPNYSSDLSAYKSNLHSNYLTALDNLFAGNITYTNFFDTYGTHVVLKGIYGGSINYFYALSSDKYDVGDARKEAVTNQLSAKLCDAINGTFTSSFEMESTLNCSTADIKESSYAIAHGGSPFTGTNISNFSSNYTSWANSVDSNPVLIGTSSDGFVPLWKLLPAKYSDKEQTLKDWFVDYAKAFNLSVRMRFPYQLTANDLLQYKVTDSSPMDVSQPYYDFTYDYPETFLYLYARGYRYVTVSVRLQMWENDRGNQQIYTFCKGETDPKTYLNHYNIEYGGSGCQKSKSYVVFNFSSEDIRCFRGGVTVRFGATGAGSDDWYFEDITISVTLTKDAIRGSNSCYSEGGEKVVVRDFGIA